MKRIIIFLLLTVIVLGGHGRGVVPSLFLFCI